MGPQVYRALLQLGCEWRMLSSYRIQCMWKPDSDPTASRGVLKRGDFKIPGEAGGAGGQGKGGANGRDEGYRVIAGLTLYRVRDFNFGCGIVWCVATHVFSACLLLSFELSCPWFVCGYHNMKGKVERGGAFRFNENKGSWVCQAT